MGAFVLPAIQLGLGLVGGLFGRKRRKQLQAQQEAAMKGMTTAGDSAQQFGSTFQGFGEQGAKGGLETLGQAGDFYKRLMGGDPQFLNELTGGKMSDISKSLAQQRSFVSRMGTRGGGGAATIAEAPAQLQSSIRGLQLGGRMMGAEGATNVGGKLGELGAQYGSLGLGGYRSAGDIYGQLAGRSGAALGEANQQSESFGGKLAGTFGQPIADQLGKWFPTKPKFPTTGLPEKPIGGIF